MRPTITFTLVAGLLLHHGDGVPDPLIPDDVRRYDHTELTSSTSGAILTGWGGAELAAAAETSAGSITSGYPFDLTDTTTHTLYAFGVQIVLAPPPTDQRSATIPFYGRTARSG